MQPEPVALPLNFGRFEIRPAERRLLVDGRPAEPGARAFDLLLALAERRERVVTKHELLELVWPGVVVEEGNLATQVSGLRKLLGGDVIATIPGRGYRFTAPVAATLSEASSASPAPAAATAAAPEPPKLQTNLPATLPRLVGRAEDLAALHELVEQHRLVSIIGAGGMGKTTVALHLTAARQGAYAHGVCWVELGTVTRPEDLPGAIAAALGVQPGRGEPLAGLAAALRPLTVLVVLDNAEQVADGVARVVQAVLDGAPGVRFVATTQVPLKLAAEQVYRIGALAVPQGPLPAAQALQYGAVALFAERAQAADARWSLTDANAPAVIALCRQLDGLALAIELAAARAPMLGVATLAASMGERLRLLTGGRNRMAPARQQTLRATLEWSHGFLDEAERTVFRRLAVFAGSGSLAMVQQVVADAVGEGDLDAWAVLDALALLVDRSLVMALTDDAAGEPRYRLLDTPRAYALERLKEAGEEEALRQRHMQAMAAYCEAAWHARFSGEVGLQDWVRAFEPDIDNVRHAMKHAVAHGDRVAALQIGATWGRAAVNSSLPVEQRIDLAELCISQVDDTVPPALSVRAWAQASRLLYDIRPRIALEAARRALDLAQAPDVLRNEPFLRYGACCNFVGAAGRGAGDRADVLAALTEARLLEDPRWTPQQRFARAEAECMAVSGDSPEALRLSREALSLELAAGGSGFVSRSNLVDAELAAGYAQAAVQTGEALLAELQGGRSEYALAYVRINLAAAWLMLDKLTRARELAHAGWPQGRLLGLQPYWADYLALIAALDSRQRAAARLVGYADAAYAAREESRQLNEAAAYTRACALARAALGEAEFERLQADGQRLTDDKIEAMAFAAADA